MTEEQGAPLDIKFQQRFSKNLISNWVYFVLNVVIGLALVPFFLDTLGPAAYGLIPLATSLTSYVTLAIDSLNTAISRFLTIDLQRGDNKNAIETFNTSLFGTLGILLLLLPVALIVAWIAPSFFNIGNETILDVFLLFFLVFVSVLVRAWSSNFMVILFAYNRLDLRNYVNLANIVTQIISIILLFIIFGPSLPSVGISYLIAAFVALGISYLLSKKICQFITISYKLFNKLKFITISIMAFWVSVNAIGWLLNAQVALIFVNILFGESAGTDYALALMWVTLLASISGLVTNVFTPMIYAYYAKKDVIGMKKFASFATKITGLVMALPIGLVCIFAPQLMTLWVGEEYVRLTPLIWLLVLPLIIRLQDSCIGSINAAYNKVRILGFANIFSGCLNIVLIIVIAHTFDIGLYGIGLASAASMLLQTGIISPLYNAYVMKIPIFTFFKPRVYGIISLGVLLLGGILITARFESNSLLMWIILGIALTCIYSVAISQFILKKTEKTIIRSCLPEKIERLIPQWLL